ncbi:MAG: hypothetical protein NVS2B14_00190 [Chamaesiphon sp.]
MNIRQLANLPQDQIRDFRVGGIPVREVSFSKKGSEKSYYSIILANGAILIAKGHHLVEDLDDKLKSLDPPGSEYRIRKYGKFGSTIN